MPAFHRATITTHESNRPIVTIVSVQTPLCLDRGFQRASALRHKSGRIALLDCQAGNVGILGSKWIGEE
jgi:hypothetical protein